MNDRLIELETALTYAEAALKVAEASHASGDITFRMYKKHEDHVQTIKDKIKLNKLL